MALVGVLLLAALVALLFYRFVSRAHKIVFAKAVGGLLALVLLAVLGLREWDESQERERQAAANEVWRRQREAITVAYLPESTTSNGYGLYRLAFRVCNVSKDTLDQFRLHATTWQKGRSGRYEVERRKTNYPWYPDSLWSDRILPPKHCVVESFRGEFTVLDSIDVWGMAGFANPFSRLR